MSWPGVFREYSRIPYRRRRMPPRGAPGNLSAITVSVAPQPITITRQTLLSAITITVGVQAATFTRQVEVAAVSVAVTGQDITASQPDSGIVPEPDFMIEVAFAVGADTSGYLVIGDATRGVIGTGQIAPDDVGALGGVWTDVTQWVRQWSVNRPSGQVDTPLPEFEPGSCQIVLDNADRRFDPTNLAGPYVASEASQVTPMRAVRIRARWADTIYELFRGFADSWQVAWQDPGDSTTTLAATDAFKVLANNRRAAVAATGAGELTGARVSRILTSAGWAAEDRVIDVGAVTCQATTLDGDALTELRLVADTEIAELYVDGSGRVVFRDRASLEADERSALSQAEFGDTYPEMPYVDLGVSGDDSTLFNQVRATRTGGAEQTADDTSSQATYLIRTFERSDLIADSDAQAATWASYVLARAAAPESWTRFDSITIDPRLEPLTLYPQVLGREFGDRVTIVRRPPGGGDPIRRDVWIRGIAHAWTETAGWESTQWTLRSAHRTASNTPRPWVSRARSWVPLHREEPRRVYRRRVAVPPVVRR